jgi:DNA-binding PadR family transcriptional regulator
MLLLLDEQPAHGYQIIRSIEEPSHGLWRPSAGSVYPALALLQLEREGRRVYQLTDAGRTYVEQRREELTAARDAVTATVDENALRLQDLVAQVETATAIACKRQCDV